MTKDSPGAYFAPVTLTVIKIQGKRIMAYDKEKYEV